MGRASWKVLKTLRRRLQKKCSSQYPFLKGPRHLYNQAYTKMKPKRRFAWKRGQRPWLHGNGKSCLGFKG